MGPSVIITKALLYMGRGIMMGRWSWILAGYRWYLLYHYFNYFASDIMVLPHGM